MRSPDEIPEPPKPRRSIPGHALDPLYGLLGANQAPQLKAFLNARHTGQVDFNADSPANLWRQAMGLNEQGGIDSAVTMFMNRYPWRDTLRLLGAMKEHGAQEFQ
jgi:hypothetical protein